MMDRKQRILTRSERLQRAGKAGDAIKLRILAGELKTMRFGQEIERGA